MAASRARVLRLVHREQVRFDPAMLASLYAQLGTRAAERMIACAMEELALRAVALNALPADDVAAVRKGARSIQAIAAQVGMDSLARVARHVVQCAAADADEVALSATRARLMRVADHSLTAIWGEEDLSV